MNPMNVFMIGGFQAVYTGLMYCAMRYGDLESKLGVLPSFSVESTMALLVLLAGLVQGMMASKTNWARVEYNNPWPHTFCLEGNKDKLRFDMVQRAHLNFVENYPQFLGVAFFSAKLAPKCAALFGTIYPLGRVVFAFGYYSGIAEKKDNGAFGYMLGIFPLYGLAWLFLAKELNFLSL